MQPFDSKLGVGTVGVDWSYGGLLELYIVIISDYLETETVQHRTSPSKLLVAYLIVMM